MEWVGETGKHYSLTLQVYRSREGSSTLRLLAEHGSEAKDA